MKDDADNHTMEMQLRLGAKTNAERQKEYRQRHSSLDLTRRLDLRIGTMAHEQLAQLAQEYGYTKREMLEQLINQAWLQALPDEQTLTHQTIQPHN
ncbi:MAG: hypothetical protein IBX55_09905 [Methyloprofundus sp.]|nr:hypothetical protein [Methyloprofundus sp.]